MATATANPVVGGSPLGSETAARRSPSSTPTHPGRALRRLAGSALRATGVFADTAFRVVVLGKDGIPAR